jgi:hypothetical protein
MMEGWQLTLTRIACLLVDHDRDIWFKSPVRAYARLPVPDGYQCKRCKALLSVYDEKYMLSKVKGYKPATKVIEGLSAKSLGGLYCGSTETI